MKFLVALTSLFASTAAASFEAGSGMTSAIPANSKAGRNLISKARRVADAQEQDDSWVANYEIKFQGCHHVSQWNEEVEDEDDVRIETLRLVRFRLCPAGECSSESGYGCRENFGDYIVDMNTYVASFLEMKEEYEEALCEAYLEAGNCVCEDNGDDAFDEDVCQSTCFAAAGMSYCAKNENALDLNEYLECGQYEPPEYYYNRKLADAEVEYFLGPYCADQGGEIKMGLFDDETCTNFADNYGYGGRTTFEAISNGQQLPSGSIINTQCWSCQGEADGDDQAAVEPTEFCAAAYEIAGKCEQYLENGSNYFTANENACTYLEGIQMTRTNGIIISGQGSKNKVAGAFIGIFAVSFILLGAYVYYLKSKLDRGRINLSD